MEIITNRIAPAVGVLIVLFALFGIVSVLHFAGADTVADLLPVAGGTYAQWTPKSGSAHYTMVDEATCNGTTDYTYTTSVGSRDSYRVNINSIPNYSTITSIEITPCASKHNNGGQNSTMNVFYRFDGANSPDAGAYALSGTTPVGLAPTVFSGLSFEKQNSSSLEIGAVYSAGSKGARLGRIAANVVYTLPNPPAAPSDLTVVATPTATTTIADLSWTDNAATEEGFTVERSSDGTSFSPIGSTAANVTAFSDYTVSSGTYYYRVDAHNAGGNSAYSNTASVTIP